MVETQTEERKDANGANVNADAPNDRKANLIAAGIDGFEDVDKAVRSALGKSGDVAASVSDSIRDTIKTVRDTRDSVVMVRVSRESVDRLDELVDAGLANSRSEAAAFLITEGITARADLYDKIAEQTEVIRNAREKLRKLLEED